jgi:AbrB family looped-hinge helix DNA binding protein
MIATMTSKGQITFPKIIRDRLKLTAGDKFKFTVTEEGTLLIIPLTASVKKLKGMLPPPHTAISLEKMDAAIAQGAAGNTPPKKRKGNTE